VFAHATRRSASARLGTYPFVLVTLYPWRTMPKKPNGKPDEELQETQPAKGDPVMIPVPSRGDVLRNLRKVAKPRRSTGGSSPKK
jgi:hypothetical protein